MILRRKRERSLASRRKVQSMFSESTGGITSLINSDEDHNTSPEDEIERENPFRDAMIKFAALENKNSKVNNGSRKNSASKSTETLALEQETKVKNIKLIF